MLEKGNNHQLIKHKNLFLIMKQIYMHSPISRVEIAHALGLTTATITGLVAPLIAEGLLRETVAKAEPNKSAGRPRVMLEFVPEAFYCCGVEVSPYHINYSLINAHGHVIHKKQTSETLDVYDKTLALLGKQIPAFWQEADIPKEKLLGVGICLPGLIDGEADRIYDTFREGWTGSSFSAELGKLLGIRVEVENNVRARAICANLLDRAVQEEPFTYFYASYGVACQMLIGDRILYGKRAAAGEIGHTVVKPDGPVCPSCGNRGCLEALAGERAILDQCREVMESGSAPVLSAICPDPEDLCMADVLEAQSRGEAAVDAIVREALQYLAIALSNTINLISPGSVIVEGLIFSSENNQKQFLEDVSCNIFKSHTTDTIVFWPYDKDRGARAAAAVVVEAFLKRHMV